MGNFLTRHGIDLESRRPRDTMNSFFRKLLWLTKRRDKQAELRKELEFHLEEEAEERHERGLKEDEARWAARRDFGKVSLVEEATCREGGWMGLEKIGGGAG